MELMYSIQKHNSSWHVVFPLLPSKPCLDELWTPKIHYYSPFWSTTNVENKSDGLLFCLDDFRKGEKDVDNKNTDPDRGDPFSRETFVEIGSFFVRKEFNELKK